MKKQKQKPQKQKVKEVTTPAPGKRVFQIQIYVLFKTGNSKDWTALNSYYTESDAKLVMDLMKKIPCLENKDYKVDKQHDYLSQEEFSEAQLKGIKVEFLEERWIEE